MRLLFPILLAGLMAIVTRPALAESFDVAPTTLDLAAGEAGLFYVANHGSRPVTVQLQPMDWTQGPDGDKRAPSTTLLVSPQFATIKPGARQSVRVMAKAGAAGATAGEQAYRLVVSELPDTTDTANGVHVMLQFSVPVFVGHNSRIKPALAFARVSENGKPVLEARNNGSQTVKVTRVMVDGIPQSGDGLFYVLPGSVRRIATPATTGTVSLHDERSGTDFNGDIAVR